MITGKIALGFLGERNGVRFSGGHIVLILASALAACGPSESETKSAPVAATVVREAASSKAARDAAPQAVSARESAVRMIEARPGVVAVQGSMMLPGNLAPGVSAAAASESAPNGGSIYGVFPDEDDPLGEAPAPAAASAPETASAPEIAPAPLATAPAPAAPPVADTRPVASDAPEETGHLDGGAPVDAGPDQPSEALRGKSAGSGDAGATP